MARAVSTPRIVDTHVHVFSRDLEMVDNARYRPGDEAPLERLLPLLDRHGVARAVLVQPSFLGTGNDYLLRSIAAAPDRLRGVAVVSPAISAGEIDALAGQGIVGIRLNLIGRDVPPLEHGPWAETLDRVAARGFVVEIQAEGRQWLKVLPPLLARHVSVVIDHFGRPRAPRVHDDVGFAAVLEAAAMPDVWVKLSAPYRGAADPMLATRILLDHAGDERLIWGSDWPWTQHPEIASYADTLHWLEAWMPEPATRTRVLVDNPARLFRFDA